MNKSVAGQTLSFLTLLYALSGSVAAEPIAPRSLPDLQFNLPPVPSRGAPGSRGEGASRGDCITGAQPLTAIVPAVAAQPKPNVWGLTTAARPRLLIYVPFAQKCTTLELILQDEAGQVVYRLPVAAPANAGLINIQVPVSTPALQPDRLYHWSLQATVTPKLRKSTDLKPKPEVYSVDGWVQRVSLNPALSQQIQQASPQQQARIYAKAGLWFDALTLLSDLRSTQPTDPGVTKDWQRLLQSATLDQFAAEPIVPVKISLTRKHQSDRDCDHKQKCR